MKFQCIFYLSTISLFSYIYSLKTQTPIPTVDDEAVQRAVEEVAAAANHQEIEPRMQHFMTHDFGHETVSI